MDYETIVWDVEDDVATVILNRPDKLNAMNGQMRVDLRHAFTRAPDEARALIVTGAGRGFCAGQDLGDAKSVADLDLERTLRDEYQPMLDALVHCPIPTIAAVNGSAAGAGMNLALCADICIAAHGASFLQAFARIGLIPDAGGTYWMPRKMGMARAMGAALLAEPIPARKAAEWGLIWDAVPDADLMREAGAKARRLAAGPTAAYRLTKEALRESPESHWADQLELEAVLQGKAGKTRDFLEGVMAFMEKRPAKFEGR